MKIFISILITIPTLALGVTLFFLSNLNIEKLLICSTVEEAYYVPSKACRYYLFNYSDSKDLTSLKGRAGLAYIFNVDNKKLKYDVIKYLIARGVGVNDVSKLDGLTPLNTAVLMNDPELVKFLLDNGARIDIPDRVNKLNAIEYNLFLQKNNKLDRSKITDIFSDYHPKDT